MTQHDRDAHDKTGVDRVLYCEGEDEAEHYGTSRTLEIGVREGTRLSNGNPHPNRVEPGQEECGR
jgi:hypothetical protein